MRDATGNTRHCRISCAAGSGQRTTSSMREALLGRRPHSSLSSKVESSFDKLFAPTAESRCTHLRFGDFLTFR